MSRSPDALSPARSTTFNRRVREIGLEVFELAQAARPRIGQKAWWLDRMMHTLDHDEDLRTRAFQFVDCLPTLRTVQQLSDHLSDYFDVTNLPLPPLLQAALAPGWLYSMRQGVVARAARFGAVQMAGRFIAGYDVPSFVSSIGRLRADGMVFTVDVLGEATTSHAQGERYITTYHTLMTQLAPVVGRWPTVPLLDTDGRAPMPRINFSIKLTGLDPYFDAIDPERAMGVVGDRLRPLFRRAQREGAFVNIDMESFRHRTLTLDLFTRLLMEEEFRDWNDVGIVVQAYLKDSEQDLARLLDWGRRRGSRFAVRLVKGAYWDMETAAAVRHHSDPPVWTHKWESDACFERLTRVMLQHVDLIRPAFASHNVRSIACVLATAESLGVEPGDYELQMLYGMGDPLKSALVQLGRCVRVYCPYGQLMPGMGYLIRRLLENTSNEGFLRQSFADRSGYDRLLADPAVARPPSTPLPTRQYQNSDPEEPMSLFQNASNTNFALASNRRKMCDAIHELRRENKPRYPLFIDGEPVSTRDWFDSINPSNPEEVVGCVAQATTAEADEAVAAARRAFPNWRALRAGDRAHWLRKVAAGIEKRRFELAAAMILEVGKPWREADADVTEAVDHWRYYADQIERIESRPRLRNLPGENNMLTYAPKGVCAVISPWSFPLAILSGMTSAALAGGNTVVIKPARTASVVAAKLVVILRDVGVPPGVVNLITGCGRIVGEHLVSHAGVNLVAFTGSQDVGTKVIRSGAVIRSGQSFIRKLIVEMGGKNAIIVDDDADLDGAAGAIVESAFSYAGQKCSSCSRLIVLDGVYDALLDRLREATASVPIGSADAPATVVGPVIDNESRVRIRDYIEIGKTEGRVLVEAELPTDCRKGYFVAPIVFVDVTRKALIAQKELFGPVLAVSRAADFDEALAIANDSRYALTGGVFSRSVSHIERARRDFAVGNLYINRRITGAQVDAQPFGGFKLSGTGVKAGSPDYLLHFMDARCITENTKRSGFVPNQTVSQIT